MATFIILALYGTDGSTCNRVRQLGVDGVEPLRKRTGQWEPYVLVYTAEISSTQSNSGSPNDPFLARNYALERILLAGERGRAARLRIPTIPF